MNANNDGCVKKKKNGSLNLINYLSEALSSPSREIKTKQESV